MNTTAPIVRLPVAGTPAAVPVRDRRPVALLVVAFLLAAAVPVLPGRLLLLDVVCLAALPLLASTLLNDRRLSALTLTIGGWALGLLLADVAAGTGPRISQHLAAAVGILAVTAALIRLSQGDPVRLRLFIAALAVGVAVAGLTVGQAGPTSAAYPTGPPPTPTILWKYTLAEPLSIAALALCDIRWRAGSRLPAFLTLPVLAILDILCDLRSLAVATLCALVLAGIAATRRIRLRPVTIVALGGIPCLLLVAGFFTAAKAGWLGERSQQQFRGDSGDVRTIMANGRPEGMQALFLISEKPFGWGSQPDIDSVTFARSLTFVQEQRVTVDVNLPKDWLAKTQPGLAAHSTALDTAVQAGLAALPFWVFLLVVGVRRAMAAIGSRAGPLVAFWTVAVVWNTLFEPFVWPGHLLLAGYLALLLLPTQRAGTRP